MGAPEGTSGDFVISRNALASGYLVGNVRETPQGNLAAAQSFALIGDPRDEKNRPARLRGRSRFERRFDLVANRRESRFVVNRHLR